MPVFALLLPVVAVMVVEGHQLRAQPRAQATRSPVRFHSVQQQPYHPFLLRQHLENIRNNNPRLRTAGITRGTYT
ncbi:hypothetical protein FIBSPDRAFT_878119 [Athelia psychrophila]|uniref:Uncharacterized protein n=1 Tax=Athelia psychrophila TaxID=1759441 RepID=A0A167VA37_9AGAM|nr:hypothetical protein FIBSPDRAFT_878119 [Fibularhizoctonia sp. CBS 109695]